MAPSKGVEEARRFLRDLENNEKRKELLAKVDSCKLIAEAARKNGYDFTGEDLDNAMNEKWCGLYGQLSVTFCFSEAPGFCGRS